ncbi:MAG: bifunctional 23S rRNA (guanine(2069)-N(7))-methyltransferase RlmK/23S rRNA (guanine(2445)-N(2))-methyltransferase RlmL [Deltaproteobacteria bacterium]|nr:bifunctional 23S rRNA (guanine(2069)-N(7))-methyltransferase RlmK/23S rRNA (guanine(2445)-N(2))-methyltransferase RlmL [Deltaproteobacteria bacterium]
MDNPSTFFAVAPRGMAPLVEDELRSLGAGRVKQSRSGVFFQGGLETAYGACLWLRTANRVLLPIARFRCETPEDLYLGIRDIPWSEHLHPDGTLAVDFNSSSSMIKHTRYGALKVKDAIVDQFRDQFGRRPSVDRARPHVRVNVYLLRDEAVVSIDLSGESLHRRGYRAEPGEAPLKENLAAAILMRAGWPEIAQRGGGLIDPMTGSGTLAIEAALMASDSAPCLLREYFGFLNWKGHRPEIWERLIREARERKSAGLKRLPPIVGYDADHRCIRNAGGSLERSGLKGHVHFERREFADCVPHPAMKAISGLVVINPPYGERMGEISDLRPLYANIGRRLKERFRGWRASLFTGNRDLGKVMGLRAEKIYSLYNGALECSLLNFRIEPKWFVERRDHALSPGAAGPLAGPSPAAEMFANRLQKNLKRIKKWLEREKVTCFRLYDKDLPEYAVAVDLYGKWVHVQEYRAPDRIDPEKARARLRDVLAVLPEVLGVPMGNIFLKERRRQKGRAQYGKFGEKGVFHEVEERGCRFLVNFTDYLDTGLFLEQRLTRSMIREMAPGKRFLNLFSYTGSATVCAAMGGARSTTSVDASRVYLNWARRNLALNGFGYNRHYFHNADCLSWLRDADQKYDLIFLDPPTFSNSKKLKTPFDVQKGHVELIRLAAGLLTEDGVILFSSNYKKFRLDLAGLKGLEIKDISRETLPPDFKRRPKAHKCWRITRYSL